MGHTQVGLPAHHDETRIRPADEADTALALEDPTPIEQRFGKGSTWRFETFYNAVNPETGASIRCVRAVIVNFVQRIGEPYPRDIITSFYGEYVD